MLMDMECCDIIQPDVGWCGGVTELIKLANYADSKGVMMVPHGSSVYSYHFVITRHNSPFAEFLMKIGRASCRASVCQSVSISVVADILKKKHEMCGTLDAQCPRIIKKQIKKDTI